MKVRTSSCHGPRRQRGAALAIGLMLMLVVTLLGLGAIRATTLQGRMAANYQWSMDVFQGAESAIRGVMSEIRLTPIEQIPAILLIALDVASAPAARTRTIAVDQHGQTGTAVLCYAGQGVAPGFSLSVDSSGLPANQFRIDAGSALPATNAFAWHQQGVQRVGPGGSPGATSCPNPAVSPI